MIVAMKRLAFVLLVNLFLMSNSVFASQYLTKYEGNTPLKLAGKQDEFKEYFGADLSGLSVGSIEAINTILNGGKNPDEYVVYSVGNEKVYFMTNILDSETGTMLKLEFGKGCYYKVWLDGKEVEIKKISDLIDTIYLSDSGEYTILLSPYTGDKFFEKYARYECKVEGIFNLSTESYSDLNNGLKYHYNEETKEYIYEYNNQEVLKTNTIMGGVCDGNVKIEIGKIFSLLAMVQDGRRFGEDRLLDSKFDFHSEGHYILCGKVYDGKKDNKILMFDFTIAKIIYTNDDFVRIPVGVKIENYKYENVVASPSYLNNNMIKIEKDGKYEITYSVKDQEIYYKNVIYRDTKKPLLKLSEDVSKKFVIKDIEITKLKESVKVVIYYNGDEMAEKKILSRDGAYYIKALDQYGNEQYLYFKKGSKYADIVKLFVLILFATIGAVVYLRIRRE